MNQELRFVRDLTAYLGEPRVSALRKAHGHPDSLVPIDSSMGYSLGSGRVGNELNSLVDASFQACLASFKKLFLLRAD